MKNIILLIAVVIIAIVAITVYRNSKREKPLVIIMMGAPGSGKGTNAIEISKKLNLPHISTGDLLRENIKNQTKLGSLAKQTINKGQLVSDELVIDMLFDHINSKGYNKTGYILDGFPRTINQAEILDSKLDNNYKKMVINLNIADEKLIDRITNRLMCKSCGAPFNKINSPPKVEGKCDFCQGDLYQREDDTKEVLKKRIEVYYKDTKPILNYYNKQNIVHDIDSNKERTVVFENLLKTIKESKV